MSPLESQCPTCEAYGGDPCITLRGQKPMKGFHPDRACPPLHIKELKEPYVSSNWATYTRPDGTGLEPYVDVLRYDVAYGRDADGKRTCTPLKVPEFRIRVKRWTPKRWVDAASFKYEPKTKPSTYALPPATVSRLVRAHLREKGLLAQT